MSEAALRRALIDTMGETLRRGLNVGTAGNASVRWGKGLLITPSGLDYAELKPADIVAMDFKGRARGPRAASSEWRFHADILAARPAFGAVVHSHPPHATALACLGRAIPAFHYMVAVAGGDDIRCAPYATFGTAKLSKHVLAALKDRAACLLANHGLIACGATLADALRLTGEVETLARQYLLALSVGKPRILSKAEMKRVRAKFKSYGHNGTST